MLLNRGYNEITFSLGAGSADAVVIENFEFYLRDGFQNGEFKAWTQENRVPEYDFPTAANMDSGFYTTFVGAGIFRSLIFEEINENKAAIIHFEIQNPDGARMPYAVTVGASAAIKKIGGSKSKLLLMIAQYTDDSRLVSVSSEKIDVSDMANREIKAFKTEIILKGNGGYVKAFLMEADTLIPCSESADYAGVQIFPDDITETPVAYELATDVLNNDGVKYAEYGLHNDAYDTDAIFYSGAIYRGNPTKVYAYIGIPKSATKENSVPTVVCVHGVRGKAEISRGGVNTTIFAGVDNRFLFAVPIYGCGYLDECKTYFSASFIGVGKTIAWDPANFAAKAEMPIMFTNSDSDENFSVDASSFTYDVTKNGYLSIYHRLGHS